MRVATICFLAAILTVLFGPLTREARGQERQEQRNRLPLVFRQFDFNGDGKVALGEVPAHHRIRGDRIFRRADRNGDGVLTVEEYTAVFGTTPGQQQGTARNGLRNRLNPAQFISRNDKNGDGKVHRSELPEQNRQLLLRLITWADRDGDEAVTREELVAVLSERARGARQQDRPRTGEADRPVTGPADRPRSDRQRQTGGFFVILDRDGDGKLSREELTRAPSLLERLDRDGDGQLGARELEGRGQTDRAPRRD